VEVRMEVRKAVKVGIVGGFLLGGFPERG